MSDTGEGRAFEEQPAVEDAIRDDTTAPGLAAPDASEDDDQTPVFQEPGSPPTHPV